MEAVDTLTILIAITASLHHQTEKLGIRITSYWGEYSNIARRIVLKLHHKNNRIFPGISILNTSPPLSHTTTISYHHHACSWPIIPRGGSTRSKGCNNWLITCAHTFVWEYWFHCCTPVVLATMKVSHCVFYSICNATQIKCFVSRPIEVYEVHGRGGEGWFW